MSKKKFKIPDNLEEKFIGEVMCQKMNMNNAKKVLDETGLGKFLDNVTAKMKDDDEMKEVIKNKTVQELILGNILSSLGISEVKITKEK